MTSPSPSASPPPRSPAALLDRVLAALLVGLRWADLRALARGEALPRPDPRLVAHSRSFWLHLRPRYYHAAATRFTHTFRLGLLATLLLVVETLTGVLLMFYYTPSPEQAYSDMVRLLSRVPFGQIVRDLHRLGGEALLVVVLLHMLRTYLTGSYKAPRRFTWLTGVLLLLAVLFLSFSGYLLPWDQLGYWAVTIGVSMAGYLPTGLAQGVQTLLGGGDGSGADVLLRFYLLHVLFVPLLTGLGFALHYYKVVRVGISLPAALEQPGEDTARRVPLAQRVYTIPDVLRSELIWAELLLLLLLGAVVLGVYRGAVLGNPADPLHTPLGSRAPWYFRWLQGLLTLGDPVLTGVVPATLLLLGLILLPLLDRSRHRRLRRRPLALLLPLPLIALLLLGTVLESKYSGGSLSGLPAPKAIAYTVLPEESVGPLRALPWEALPPGVWDTRTLDSNGAPEPLRAVLAQINALIEQPPGNPSFGTATHATLVISQWQADLKRLVLRVFWQSADGQPQVLEREVYLAGGGRYD
ncbi:MAG: cytochrome b N-terminal domain-containing protein [Caldilineales bacterium]